MNKPVTRNSVVRVNAAVTTVTATKNTTEQATQQMIERINKKLTTTRG
jgi:hypothetical protein